MGSHSFFWHLECLGSRLMLSTGPDPDTRPQTVGQQMDPLEVSRLHAKSVLDSKST